MGHADMSLCLSVLHLSPGPWCGHQPRDRALRWRRSRPLKTHLASRLALNTSDWVMKANKHLAHTICFQRRNNGLAKHQPLVAGIKG